MENESPLNLTNSPNFCTLHTLENVSMVTTKFQVESSAKNDIHNNKVCIELTTKKSLCTICLKS